MSYVDRNILPTERLRARRSRVRLIRKRVLATGGAFFALAWGVIFVQLVSGHDPALSHSKARTSTSSSSSDGTSSGTGSTGLTGSGSAGSQGSSSGSAAPSTTSQS